MTFSRTSLVRIAGMLWFIIGISLFLLGLYYVQLGAKLLPTLAYNGSFSIIMLLSIWFGKIESASAFLKVIALALGYVKGRFVLKKTVERQIERISKLSERSPIYQVYSRGLYLLIGGMMLLGMSLKFMPIFIDTRGFIDLAVGFALMNGSFHYTRMIPRLRELTC